MTMTRKAAQGATYKLERAVALEQDRSSMVLLLGSSECTAEGRADRPPDRSPEHLGDIRAVRRKWDIDEPERRRAGLSNDDVYSRSSLARLSLIDGRCVEGHASELRGTREK
jgi:hypothetical protein